MNIVGKKDNGENPPSIGWTNARTRHRFLTNWNLDRFPKKNERMECILPIVQSSIMNVTWTSWLAISLEKLKLFTAKVQFDAIWFQKNKSIMISLQHQPPSLRSWFRRGSNFQMEWLVDELVNYLLRPDPDHETSGGFKNYMSTMNTKTLKLDRPMALGDLLFASH